MGRTPDPGAPVWSDQDRDIAVAWVVWQETLCPLCGLPRDVCHDPDAVREWTGETQVCWITERQQKAMKRLRAQQSPDVEVDLDGVHPVARRVTG